MTDVGTELGEVVRLLRVRVLEALRRLIEKRLDVAGVEKLSEFDKRAAEATLILLNITHHLYCERKPRSIRVYGNKVIDLK
jgi:hypothetical protein